MQDVSIAAIQTAAAEAFGVPLSDLLSDRQDRPATEARQVAMALSRELTRHSYPAIGRQFDRDHTTVMYASRLVRKRQNNDADFALAVQTIREKFRPTPAFAFAKLPGFTKAQSFILAKLLRALEDVERESSEDNSLEVRVILEAYREVTEYQSAAAA